MNLDLDIGIFERILSPMNRPILLKRGDTGPAFTGTLRDGAGVAVDLTGATLRFLMREAGPPRALKVDAVAVVTDAPGGRFSYGWQAADTDTVGAFDAEVEVTFIGGEVETFPSSGYQRVRIIDDIA